jgi:hypothetical protein
MKMFNKFFYGFLLVGFSVLMSHNLYAQNIYQEKKSNIYLGFDINLATLSSGTSIKSTVSLKAGFDYRLNENFSAGPQLKILFINSPLNKGLKASIFAGPTTNIEFTKLLSDKYLTKDASMFSNRISWVFPVNSKSSDYIYKDCLSISTSYKNSSFNFYRTSLDLNIDFQGYDIGFYNGFNRMINLSTGSVNTFK